MSTFQIIYCIFIIIIFPFTCVLHSKIEKWKDWNVSADDNVYRTENWINTKWSYLSQIIGFVGSGKSSTTNGIVHCLERKLMRLKNKVIEESKLIFLHFDFNKFNAFLFNKFQNEERLIDVIDEVQKDSELFIYNNFLNNITSHDQLRKYITAFYYSYFDNNMIISKDKIYSHNTGQKSYILEDDALKLVDAYENNSWVLHNYTITVRDENNLTRGSSQSNSSVIKNDSVKQLFQLYRNIFEGTSYFINIQQDADDAVAQERRLFGTNLLIEGHKQIKTCSFLYELLTKKYHKRIKRFYRNRWLLIFFGKYNPAVEVDKPKSYIRTQKTCIKIVEDFLNSIGYIVTSAKNYKKCKDVGSSDEKTFEELELWFPIHENYGPSETHAYKWWDILLARRSNKKLRKYQNKEEWAEEQIQQLAENKVEKKQE